MTALKKIELVSLCSLAVVLASAATALAASGSAEHAGGSPLMGIFWQVLNFAILVTLLTVFARKPIAKFLADRREMIRKGIDGATEAKALAERALGEINERLSLKDAEIEKIINAARASGEKEREAVRDEGQRLSEKIREQARANIQFELEQARVALRAEAAELALELARKKIGETLGPEEQRLLVEEALNKMESRTQ